MSAASVTSVAQLSHCETRVKTCGTGSDPSRPKTANTMSGTQIQCSNSLVGCRWLTPYSSSHSLAVRMLRSYAALEFVATSYALREPDGAGHCHGHGGSRHEPGGVER